MASVSKVMFDMFREVREHVISVLSAYERTRSFILNMENSKRSGHAARLICSLIRKEMAHLVPRDFPARYAAERLIHIPRYLRAMEIRAERGAHNPEKDRTKEKQTEVYVKDLKKMTDGLSAHASREKREMIDEFRWMIEEFKVSLFAPELGTAFPVSPKRLDRYKQELERII